TTVSARSIAPFDQNWVTLRPASPRVSACAYQVGGPLGGFSCLGPSAANAGSAANSQRTESARHWKRAQPPRSGARSEAKPSEVEQWSPVSQRIGSRALGRACLG